MQVGLKGKVTENLGNSAHIEWENGDGDTFPQEYFVGDEIPEAGTEVVVVKGELTMEESPYALMIQAAE